MLAKLIKFILFISFSIQIQTIKAKNQEDDDLIVQYLSNNIIKIATEYPNHYALVTPNMHTISKNEKKLKTLCKSSSLSCEVFFISKEMSNFVGRIKIIETEQTKNITNTNIIRLKNQHEFSERLKKSWTPIKKLGVIHNNNFKNVTFIIDSGADITYLSLSTSNKLKIHQYNDCLFYSEMNGSIKGGELLCVVEIDLRYENEDFKTYALLGNSRTSDENLLGIYKFFSYFEVIINRKTRNVSFKKIVDDIEKNNIKEDL
jgi:hypothetical protein